MGRGRGNLDVVVRIGIKCQPVRMKIRQARFSGEEALRIHTDRMALLKIPAVSHPLPQCCSKDPGTLEKNKDGVHRLPSPRLAWLPSWHGAQTSSTGPHAHHEAVLHVTDVRPRP